MTTAPVVGQPMAVSRIAGQDQDMAASRRNMVLLVQLRWIAVAGQVVTIIFARQGLGVDLPLANLLMVPLVLALINVASLAAMRARGSFANVELLAVVLLDVAALAWQLYHSGGARNPFAFLFLLQIVIGAILIDPRWSWLIALAASGFMLLLTFHYQPLLLPVAGDVDAEQLYLAGSLICFFLIAILLMFFVVRLDRNRRESDAALAQMKQQAAEEDHIVRIGLLATGAAHELGTPLSSLSVIVGDWMKMPVIAKNPDLVADVREVQAELKRCKSILSGILLSAGEIRGEKPMVTTMGEFLDQIMGEWTRRMPGQLHFENLFRDDIQIVSDPALKQVIGNVIDNAVEVSPQRILISAARIGDDLVLDVRDYGPGFTIDMLRDFGRPYASTKGRAGGGLGLFLVGNVMRKLGGRVEVANPLDGGASVRMTIPLASLAYDIGGEA